MSKTKLINIRSGEPYQVYIGRAVPRKGLAGSKWGNPFKSPRDGTVEECLQQYRSLWQWKISDDPQSEADLEELRGTVMGCWCKPAEGFQGRLLCHGQILLELLGE